MPVKAAGKICRLCRSGNGLSPVAGVDDRRYVFCNTCFLIQAGREHFLDRQEERKRYLTHQNGIEYEGYVKFLNLAIGPALEFIGRDMVGLDYGCGHAPTLSRLLGRKGYRCEDYDPFFVRHRLDKVFDFIFSTEVFEHFSHPGREIRKIRSLLEKDGLLVVMTDRWKTLEHFARWHYARDRTHVSFYHSRTFDFLCGNFGFSRVYDDGNRVTILRKH
jgi:hypothetical protein